MQSAILALVLLLAPMSLRSAPAQDDMAIAMKLAELLRAARTVVSLHQDLINDPGRADKGLTGERVVAEAVAEYREQTGEDPRSSDPATREGRLLHAQMAAISEVVEENQDTINAPGIAFKGFIPAVFARLVNEKFEERMGQEARIKVTAPEGFIRNRKALPDTWEATIIAEEFAKSGRPEGKPFTEVVDVDGRRAFRMLVPEYYQASCLTCHGQPAGEVDITGYPKEGGEEGDLGAAISIILFDDF